MLAMVLVVMEVLVLHQPFQEQLLPMLAVVAAVITHQALLEKAVLVVERTALLPQQLIMELQTQAAVAEVLVKALEQAAQAVAVS